MTQLRSYKGGIEMKKIIQRIMPTVAAAIVTSEEVSALIATTNATDFQLRAYEILSEDGLKFTVRVFLYGHQNKGRPLCGDKIEATVSGELKKQEDSWILEKYSINDHKILNLA